MSMTPLKADILEEGVRPRDWQPRRSRCKVTFRLLRLCLLGAFLPAALVAGPIYLRYRVYSEQLYPLAVSDQRLINARVSTTWCQSQIIKANATFNAYLMSEQPNVKSEVFPVSMTRHLILEDDMKEYWGFYLLRGSSVTVSTCVRWPGASLTIIRGHKHLHECAFIGDDSSEELEELLEIAEEQGLLHVNGTEPEGPSNEPEKMKRVRQEVHFHHKASAVQLNSSRDPTEATSHPYGSHELDAKAMRHILANLFIKTMDTKKKQKENPHHHYEGVYRESANIDKPPKAGEKFSQATNDRSAKGAADKDGGRVSRTRITKSTLRSPETNRPRNKEDQKNPNSEIKSSSIDGTEEKGNFSKPTSNSSSPKSITATPIGKEISSKETVGDEDRESSSEPVATSAEVFRDVLERISSLGTRGKRLLRKLMDEIDSRHGEAEGEALKRMVNETMSDKSLSKAEKLRRRRDLVFSSPLHAELLEEDEDGDAAIEEGTLNPDGIAEDRGTVDENTLNDKSNSEFWSSFSSSEERLLECKGLILNLPLTPHRHCTPKHENRHLEAAFANTVTYRVPMDGYYFFVFNSENEIQPNYIRVQFDLLKTVYNTSNPVHSCQNSTKECTLPFKIFSSEKTVLELPLSGNESQWNDEYVVVSVCEPRTSIYILCIILVPLLILVFAFY